MLSVTRLAARSVVVAMGVAIIAGAIGGLVLGFGEPVMLAVLGIALIGLLGIGAVAGFLTLMPADDPASLAFRMLSCGLVRGGVTVAGIVGFQLAVSPPAPVLVLGCGVLWAALTIVELSIALPILRARQIPAGEGSAPGVNQPNNISSDARNA